ncbi:MAG: hypothetical protein Q9217_001455 [Psora testacea]
MLNPAKGSRTRSTESASEFFGSEMQSYSPYPQRPYHVHTTTSTSSSHGSTPSIALNDGPEEPGVDNKDHEGLEDDGYEEETIRCLAEQLTDKRKLKRLNHSQTRFLLNEFSRQPHPEAAHRVRISRGIPGLSPRQVQVWFQNSNTQTGNDLQDTHYAPPIHPLPASVHSPRSEQESSQVSPVSQRTSPAQLPTSRAVYASALELQGPWMRSSWTSTPSTQNLAFQYSSLHQQTERARGASLTASQSAQLAPFEGSRMGLNRGIGVPQEVDHSVYGLHEPAGIADLSQQRQSLQCSQNIPCRQQQGMYDRLYEHELAIRQSSHDTAQGSVHSPISNVKDDPATWTSVLMETQRHDLGEDNRPLGLRRQGEYMRQRQSYYTEGLTEEAAFHGY